MSTRSSDLISDLMAVWEKKNMIIIIIIIYKWSLSALGTMKLLQLKQTKTTYK